MTTNQLMQESQSCVMNTYGRFPLAIQRGKGAKCWDFEGKEYIDFTSGIGVNALGFCHEGWAAAVIGQISTLTHTSNLYYTAPGVQVAKKLTESTGLSKMFFANSGAEANEGAVKLARKYSRDKYGEGRYEILTLVNSFHGRTVTTLSATGQEVFHRNFFPFTEGFSHAEANNIGDVKSKVTEKTCAILLEMVQGEGGVLPLEEEFVRQVAALCKEKDLLLMVDEVQTGIGRTGKLFAYQHYGISPQVVTVAKGLGGGLPIGGFLVDESCQNVLGPGDHATTFGMNPVICAGASYLLDQVNTPAFLKDVAEKGEYLREKLAALPGVTQVRGKALVLGVEIPGKPAANVVKAGIEKGLLLLTAKTAVRLLPPLNITYEEIDQGLAILNEILS